MKTVTARGRCLSLFYSGLVLCLMSSLAQAQAKIEPQEHRVEAAPTLADLVKSVLIASTAEGFTDERHWNKTATRFDGLKIRGLRISKRKKTVRHGLCRKYAVSLPNPEKHLQLKIEEVPDEDESSTAFVIRAAFKARCEATFAHYVYGVKGVNGTTLADADIHARLLITIDPQTHFSLAEPIPRLSLNMRVRDVDLWIKDVDVYKIGALDGKAAELIGDGSQEAIEQLVQTQENKIKRKLQTEIDKIQGSSPGSDAR